MIVFRIAGLALLALATWWGGGDGFLVGMACWIGCELAGALMRHRAPSAVRGDWLRRLGVRRTRHRFPAFDQIVSAVGSATHRRFDFDHGLRAMLTEAAAVGLLDHHGVDLYADPRAARALLGEETWALLDPHRPRENDRSARGPDNAQLDRVLASIEALSRADRTTNDTQPTVESRP